MATYKQALKLLCDQTAFHLLPFCRTLYYNFFRKNSFRLNKRSLLVSTAYSVFDLHRNSVLNINGLVMYGYKKYRGSRLETSLWMDEGAVFNMGSLKGGFGISHGSDIQIFKNAKLSVGSCAINRNVQIICQEEIVIGDDVLISRDVVIRDNDGGHKVLTEGYKPTAPVHIGDHVWIGQGAMIMKGVTIGDGAIIGAGAFVATNVKPGSLVMPDPARTFAKNVEWQA